MCAARSRNYLRFQIEEGEKGREGRGRREEAKSPWDSRRTRARKLHNSIQPPSIDCRALTAGRLYTTRPDRTHVGKLMAAWAFMNLLWRRRSSNQHHQSREMECMDGTFIQDRREKNGMIKSIIIIAISVFEIDSIESRPDWSNDKSVVRIFLITAEI